jgi:hypothetical protein
MKMEILWPEWWYLSLHLQQAPGNASDDGSGPTLRNKAWEVGLIHIATNFFPPCLSICG